MCPAYGFEGVASLEETVYPIFRSLMMVVGVGFGRFAVLNCLTA